MVEKKTPLVVAAFTKKEKSKIQIQQAKQTHNLLLSIVVFVYESYLFNAWYMSIHAESKSTTLCVLLSMSMMSTSNFEYE